MANCPKCGSSHITLKKETNVSWGRAVAGWALFGVVGGAVGAVTGDDRNVNACLDCGTSWRATDLYKTRESIKKLTGKTIDLAVEEDRVILNKFVSEVGPYIEAIEKANQKAGELSRKTREKTSEKATAGCAFGCTGLVMCFFSLASVASMGLLAVIIILPIAGLLIGLMMDKANQKAVEQEIAKADKEAAQLKAEAKENFNYAVREFVDKYAL